MTYRRRMFDYGLALCILLLPLLLLRKAEKREVNGLDQVVLRVASPVQSLVTWGFGSLRDAFSRYAYLVDTESQNAELTRQIAALKMENQALATRARAADQLESLLKLTERVGPDAISARVIAAPTSAFFRVSRLRIEAGRVVHVGNPVVGPDGLVGRISEVYGAYADVLLVSDARSSVDIEIARTGGRGLLTGLSDPASYGAKIEYLERGREVAVGDVAITSGLGGAFPRGIPVGVVTEVLDAGIGLHQKVVVRPSAQLNGRANVLVLPMGGARL